MTKSASNPTVDEGLEQRICQAFFGKTTQELDLNEVEKFMDIRDSAAPLITRERTAAYNRGREVEKSMVPVHRKAAQTELLDELVETAHDEIYTVKGPGVIILDDTIAAHRTKLTGEDKDNE